MVFHENEKDGLRNNENERTGLEGPAVLSADELSSAAGFAGIFLSV